MSAIELQNVTKSFRIPSVRRDTIREHALKIFHTRSFERLNVLEDVTFHVEPGETVGLMGRNGSGKSTLLKIVCGIYQPDEGRVRVEGALTSVLELGVGWNPELNAVDNVLLLATVMGLSLAEARSALPSILHFADLERFANLELKHYSSGMAARLAYAVAFSVVRETLILDETFEVGDAGFKARCAERYVELKEDGRTTLMVSHDPSLVARFCDRALLLEQGRIVLSDRADRVANAYLKLLGRPPMGVDSTLEGVAGTR